MSPGVKLQEKSFREIMENYGFQWDKKLDDRLWVERLCYEWKSMKYHLECTVILSNRLSKRKR